MTTRADIYGVLKKGISESYATIALYKVEAPRKKTLITCLITSPYSNKVQGLLHALKGYFQTKKQSVAWTSY